MGVWIETERTSCIPADRKSHPVWVCGLKLAYHKIANDFYRVTPCMGVWIETNQYESLRAPFAVTPCMGVWIETK